MLTYVSTLPHLWLEVNSSVECFLAKTRLEELRFSPLNLVNGLFEIDCASELEDDARIILTADHAVVSGRALRELLSDAETACRIRDVCLRQQTWEQLRKTLEDWRCGRVQRLLAPIPGERFAQSLARLTRELERIHGGEAMEQPAGNEQEATE